MILVNVLTNISLTLIPSAGIFTEWVSEALKSKSKTVAPPLASVTVSRGVPDAVFNCICLIRAGPTASEPVPVILLDPFWDPKRYQNGAQNEQKRNENARGPPK